MIPLFGASAVMTETLHMVFRHSAGERGWENKLARGLMASRLAGTGSAGAFELYVQMQADLKKVTPQELLSNKNFTAAHAQGKLRQARDNAVGKVIAEGGRGEFYKLRLGGAITAVESWLLLAKAKELANAPSGSEEAVRRAVLEFTAASLTITASYAGDRRATPH